MQSIIVTDTRTSTHTEANTQSFQYFFRCEIMINQREGSCDIWRLTIKLSQMPCNIYNNSKREKVCTEYWNSDVEEFHRTESYLKHNKHA